MSKLTTAISLFPSPFGIHVLKFMAQVFIPVPVNSVVSVPFRDSRSEILAHVESYGYPNSFPSPFGVRVLKFNLSPLWLSLSVFLFPSPFGVRVLKLVTRKLVVVDDMVSVPFRGSCSEITLFVCYTYKFSDSFRPLSGFVF